jgi:hypothetical protein
VSEARPVGRDQILGVVQDQQHSHVPQGACQGVVVLDVAEPKGSRQTPPQVGRAGDTGQAGPDGAVGRPLVVLSQPIHDRPSQLALARARQPGERDAPAGPYQVHSAMKFLLASAEVGRQVRRVFQPPLARGGFRLGRPFHKHRLPPQGPGIVQGRGPLQISRVKAPPCLAHRLVEPPVGRGGQGLQQLPGDVRRGVRAQRRVRPDHGGQVSAGQQRPRQAAQHRVAAGGMATPQKGHFDPRLGKHRRHVGGRDRIARIVGILRMPVLVQPQPAGRTVGHDGQDIQWILFVAAGQIEQRLR